MLRSRSAGYTEMMQGSRSEHDAAAFSHVCGVKHAPGPLDTCHPPTSHDDGLVSPPGPASQHLQQHYNVLTSGLKSSAIHLLPALWLSQGFAVFCHFRCMSSSVPTVLSHIEVTYLITYEFTLRQHGIYAYDTLLLTPDTCCCLPARQQTSTEVGRRTITP